LFKLKWINAFLICNIEPCHRWDPAYSFDADDSCRINLRAFCLEEEEAITEIYPVPNINDEDTYFDVVVNAIDLSNQPVLYNDVNFKVVGNEDNDKTVEVKVWGHYIVTDYTPNNLAWRFAVPGDRTRITRAKIFCEVCNSPLQR